MYKISTFLILHWFSELLFKSQGHILRNADLWTKANVFFVCPLTSTERARLLNHM
jgi:hypothetical protein